MKQGILHYWGLNGHVTHSVVTYVFTIRADYGDNCHTALTWRSREKLVGKNSTRAVVQCEWNNKKSAVYKEILELSKLKRGLGRRHVPYERGQKSFSPSCYWNMFISKVRQKNVWTVSAKMQKIKYHITKQQIELRP